MIGLISGNMLKEFNKRNEAFFAHFIVTKLCLERELNVLNHAFIYHPLQKKLGLYCYLGEVKILQLVKLISYATFYHAVS